MTVGIIRHMTALVFRPASLVDAPALAATVEEGFASYREWAPRGWDPPSAAVGLIGIRDRLPEPGCFCVLAEAGGGPARHVADVPAPGEPRGGPLWMLLVPPPRWGARP